MSTRAELPRKRAHEVLTARVGSTKVHLGLGMLPDGGLREIWIDVHREGSPVRALYHLIAQLTSIALREGVSLRRISKAFRSVDLDPVVVSDHDTITSARSIPDFIGQVLMLEHRPGLVKAGPT